MRQAKARPSEWSINHERNKISVRVTFQDGLVMLFGTSYRSWWDQLHEYIRTTKKSVKHLETSAEPWVGYGGLKWCSPEEFQNQLDQEGKNRKTEAFVFKPASDWDWDRFSGAEFA